jgi:hypothetical protein
MDILIKRLAHRRVTTSRAAIDARFEKTNARILKTKPVTDARFPPF